MNGPLNLTATTERDCESEDMATVTVRDKVGVAFVRVDTAMALGEVRTTGSAIGILIEENGTLNGGYAPAVVGPENVAMATDAGLGET